MSKPAIFPASYYHLLTIKAVRFYIEKGNLNKMMTSNYEGLLKFLQQSYDENSSEPGTEEYLRDDSLHSAREMADTLDGDINTSNRSNQQNPRRRKTDV